MLAVIARFSFSHFVLFWLRWLISATHQNSFQLVEVLKCVMIGQNIVVFPLLENRNWARTWLCTMEIESMCPVWVPEYATLFESVKYSVCVKLDCTLV